jgi:hypothetical protein
MSVSERRTALAQLVHLLMLAAGVPNMAHHNSHVHAEYQNRGYGRNWCHRGTTTVSNMQSLRPRFPPAVVLVACQALRHDSNFADSPAAIGHQVARRNLCRRQIRVSQ